MNDEISLADDLYYQFLKDFPSFKTSVKKYELQGPDVIKIYTKQGLTFMFRQSENGFELWKDA